MVLTRQPQALDTESDTLSPLRPRLRPLLHVSSPSLSRARSQDRQTHPGATLRDWLAARTTPAFHWSLIFVPDTSLAATRSPHAGCFNADAESLFTCGGTQNGAAGQSGQKMPRLPQPRGSPRGRAGFPGSASCSCPAGLVPRSDPEPQKWSAACAGRTGQSPSPFPTHLGRKTCASEKSEPRNE